MVVSESELVEAVARDRAAERTVAFANGCFDLLHVGHVRYLQASAAEADRLIVAVNDDRSVAGLKGEGRPILPASERAELVAALRGVDYVVVFGEATVERLLRLVKPDVHCKGTDYTVDTVPERGVVAGYGGRTAIVGDAKQHATRELLARIAGTEGRRTACHGPRQGSGAPVNRILIVRLGALGDVVHAIPVAAALRRAFPAARIDWLVSAKHREILDLVPVIDRRLVVSDRPAPGSGPSDPEARRCSRRSANCGARATTWRSISRGSSSRRCWRAPPARRASSGFASRYARERVARLFYTDAYDPGRGGLYDPRETRHVVDINLGLLGTLGIDAPAREFPIEAIDSDTARIAREQTGGRYALLNPGAAWPNKRWPPERLAAIARELFATTRAEVGRVVGAWRGSAGVGGGCRRKRRRGRVAADHHRGSSSRSRAARR